MWELVVAVATAFGVVFLAELGDKTQLLALGFGAKYRLRTVAIGLAIGYGAAGAIAALVGGVLGAALPDRPIAIAGGVIFIGFGVFALRTDGHDDDGRVVEHASSVIASIALSIAIGEIGDKTQLATATLAARANPIATWLGATLGAATAGMIGAIAGQRVGSRLDRDVLRYSSAALFAVFGVLLLISAL